MALRLCCCTNYGLGIRNRLKDEMPSCPLDTAAVYRSLQQLEEAGAVESSWDTSDPGPAKKRYELTGKGWVLLDGFRQDMVMRVRNMEFFLTAYEALRKDRAK